MRQRVTLNATARNIETSGAKSRDGIARAGVGQFVIWMGMQLRAFLDDHSYQFQCGNLGCAAFSGVHLSRASKL
jgi:hypothetical protein